MSKTKHKPKGQQLVDVKKLLEHMKWMTNFRKKNNNAALRKYRLEFKYEKFKTTDDFWRFITTFNGIDYFHNVFTQAERNFFKMYPGVSVESLEGGHFYNFKYSSIQTEHNIILMKLSKKKKHFFDKDEWKEMIDFIRYIREKTGASYYHIIYCVPICSDAEAELYCEYLKKFGVKRGYSKDFIDSLTLELVKEKCWPRLLEKDKENILSAGTEFEKELEFTITREELFGNKEQLIKVKGWRFRIL